MNLLWDSSVPIGKSRIRHRTGLMSSTLADIIVPVRASVRKMLDGADRLVHPSRHRRVRSAVKARRPLGSVLFVCHGNICRSPYAEVRFRHLLKKLSGFGGESEVQVSSRGFVLPGRRPPATALQIASDLGVSLDGHRAQVVTESCIRGAGLVLVMTSGQARRLRRTFKARDVVHLGDLDPGSILRRNIQDPENQPEEVFREVYARIDRALLVLVELLCGDAADESPGAAG